MSGHPEIPVVSFEGGQLNHLVGRDLRDMGYGDRTGLVDREEFNPDLHDYTAAIIPGGPDYAGEMEDLGFRDMEFPVLGFCLGYQKIVEEYGGEVEEDFNPDYGVNVPVRVEKTGGLFRDDYFEEDGSYGVLMSHGDSVTRLPPDFEVTCRIDMDEDDKPIAGFRNEEEQVYGVQFHPEAYQTKIGPLIIDAFLAKTEEFELTKPEELLELRG